MNCQEVQKLLPEFWDGELDADSAEAVRMHLKDCSVCEESMLVFKELAGDIRDLPEVMIPDSFTAEVVSRIYRLNPRRLSIEREGLMPRFVLACAGGCSVLVLAILIVVGRTLQPLIRLLANNMQVGPWVTDFVQSGISFIRLLFFLGQSLLLSFRAVINDVWLTQPQLAGISILAMSCVILGFHLVTREGFAGNFSHNKIHGEVIQ